MERSRRQFICGSVATGSVLLAGCLATPTGNTNGTLDDNNNDDDDNNDDTGGNGDDPCEEVDLALIDDPPHNPERPPQPTGDNESEAWNEHYLGEGMADSPTVSFDPINLRFKDSIGGLDYDAESVFYAKLITSQEEFDEYVEPAGEDSEERAAEIDFEDEAVIAVLSGFGSSSVGHRWVRVEDNCTEYRLHGYYTQPYVRTSDYTTRTSGVVVEKPDDHDLEHAWVSLTVGEGTRANFSTDQDVQLVQRDDDSEENEGDGDETVERVKVVVANRPSAGDWYREDSDDTGVVVRLDDEEEVRELTNADEEDVERFIIGTDFEEDTVFFVESAGPDACHRTLTVSNIEAAGEDGNLVQGVATVENEAGEDEACADVISHPAALVRVETANDVPVKQGEFRITDGWGEESVVESVPMSEFAQE